MYIEITFKEITEATKDLLIASLPAAEGFEEMDNNELKAIFLEETYNEAEINDLAAGQAIQFEKNKIESQNWNALWESNFSPVVVDDFVGIRASFHEPQQNVQHEIIITPKMSFGTGHHATTFLVMQQMRKIDFNGKTVFDFGTGTGVLAILAAKLGASHVVANDIDDWSIENARENFERNDVPDILLKKADSALMNEHFDIILANINRNVLLENIPTLSKQLEENGHLILSGILEEDRDGIDALCRVNDLDFEERTEKNNWICLAYKKLRPAAH